MDGSDIQVRLADEQDADAILEVCGDSLGWKDPEFDRALFRWKHFENAFGPSIIFVAEAPDGIQAVRPLLQWRFSGASPGPGHSAIKAARAVDTATRASARGKGLFRTLTQAGLEELRSRDFGFIFNTPNDQSRPGYVKMGWTEAGRVRFGFAPQSLLRLPTIAQSRVPAEKKSIETPDLGTDVVEGLSSIGSDDDLARLLTPNGAKDGSLTTAHTLDTLAWRFARGPISYRWLPTSHGEGVIVRLRKRGPSHELLVALALVRSVAPAWDAVRAAMRQVDADYCLTPAGFGSTRAFARLGPTLTLRSLGLSPQAESFSWSPGDIELF